MPGFPKPAPAKWVHVRAACEEIFSLRQKHTWPPTIIVLPGWPEPYAKLARETGFPIEDVNSATLVVNTLIERIVAA